MISRRSLRAFLTTPVSNEVIQEILEKSARAPSGTNMQPWRVYVTTGNSRQALSDAVCEAFDSQKGQYDSEKRYYPENWFEPYISRRRKGGVGSIWIAQN
ncbi:MAG: nitroreductase family protein [Arenicellales bacterium]